MENRCSNWVGKLGLKGWSYQIWAHSFLSLVLFRLCCTVSQQAHVLRKHFHRLTLQYHIDVVLQLLTSQTSKEDSSLLGEETHINSYTVDQVGTVGGPHVETHIDIRRLMDDSSRVLWVERSQQTTKGLSTFWNIFQGLDPSISHLT